MSLRIRDDFIRLESIIGSNTSQVVAGGTFAIPGSMPAADRIVKMSAIAGVKEQWVEEDQINVEGTVSVSLIYAGRYDEGQIYYGGMQSVEVVAFNHFVNIPRAMPGMEGTSRVVVLDLQPTLRNDGRTIDVDFVLEVCSTVYAKQEATFLTDVTGAPNNLKMSKETLHLHDVIGRGLGETLIRDTLPLPLGLNPPIRILQLEGSFRSADERATVNRGIITGTMSYKAICVVLSEHSQEEQLVVHQWDNIGRVELGAEIPGVRNGMDVCAEVEQPILVGRLTDGGQSIDMEGVLRAHIKVVQPRDMGVITSLVTEGDLQIGIREETLMVERMEKAAPKDIQVEGSVDLPTSRPPLERLLDVDARAVAADITWANGRANVSGYLDLSVIYIARTDDFTQPAYHASWNNAGIFEASFSMPNASGEADLAADVTILRMDGEPLSRETIGFRGVLNITCRAKERVTKEIIAEAVELRKFQGRSPTYTSVTLQAEDSLWQLATRYGISIDALVEQNPILADLEDYEAIPAGSKIIICRQGAAL